VCALSAAASPAVNSDYKDNNKDKDKDNLGYLVTGALGPPSVAVVNLVPPSSKDKLVRPAPKAKGCKVEAKGKGIKG